MGTTFEVGIAPPSEMVARRAEVKGSITDTWREEGPLTLEDAVPASLGRLPPFGNGSRFAGGSVTELLADPSIGTPFEDSIAVDCRLLRLEDRVDFRWVI